MGSDDNQSVGQQAAEMYSEIGEEVKHEAHNMRATGEPAQLNQSDRLVRRHVTGISISFFILIALFLLAAIAGIALYQHGHRAGPHRMVGAFIAFQISH